MVPTANDAAFQNQIRHPAGFPGQLEERDTVYRPADFFVIACILILGSLTLFSVDQASDFMFDDVYYADCAKSLLARGFYGILDRPETTQPPGVSAILALLCLAGGCKRAVFLSAIAVLETLGFLASYAVLRRLAPRAIAGTICLLLMSSSLYFSLATRWVSTCFPLLFATMSALLVARKLDGATRLASKIAWGTLLSALFVASLMIGSAALALLGGVVVWIAITMVRDRSLGVARLKLFLPVVLVGVVATSLWMGRKPPDEWPVPGFPRPYFQQLFLKNGHYPELGYATLGDIPIRIARKAYEESKMLTEVLVRHWIDPSWASLLIAGPLVLIFAGWCYSIWKTGGTLEDWYFVGGDFILLMWPWRLDERSFLPLAPLTCLYLWRGFVGISTLAEKKPRLLGALWLPAAMILTNGSSLWMRGEGAASPTKHFGFQGAVSLAAWVISGILAAYMIWKGSRWLEPAERIGNWFSQWKAASNIRARVAAQVVGAILVASLIVMGVAEQLEMRRDNLDLASPMHGLTHDVEAALWVRNHTPPHAVVMARLVPTTYHHSGREMVWFPPSSNVQILMDGIRKYKVNYVVLIHRRQSYFLPPEEDCFAAVLAANANAFRLVTETPSFRIYETVSLPEH
ncbi:MAG TPA: hypothetical protein VJO16_22685 [Candidatus Acidoferrum sp.]|nr:hypothetical protein [Candidatus Acidoferrum sp.]